MQQNAHVDAFRGETLNCFQTPRDVVIGLEFRISGPIQIIEAHFANYPCFHRLFDLATSGFTYMQYNFYVFEILKLKAFNIDTNFSVFVKTQNTPQICKCGIYKFTGSPNGSSFKVSVWTLPKEGLFEIARFGRFVRI